MQTFSKQTIGYGIAAIVAIIGNTIFTWVKEENPAVRDFLKQIMYHHWIAHGVAVLLVFFVLGFVLSRVMRASECKTLTPLLVISTALGALGLVALFLVLG